MKYNCVVCVCCIIFNFETLWKLFSQNGEVCNGFEINSVSEKHMVEDNVLFTNHQVGKWEILVEVVECYPSCREDMVQTGCD